MITFSLYTKLFLSYVMDQKTPLELQICNNSDDVWCLLWETFGNASMTYDLVSTSSSSSHSFFSSFSSPLWCWWWNGIQSHNCDDKHENFFDYPVKLAIITGLLILTLFTESRIIPSKIDNHVESTVKSIALMTLNIFCFMLIAPFITLILIIFFVYRKIIDVILNVSMGEDFGGLLEGTDCVWAIEDATGLSVINVLGILEIKKDKNQNEDSLKKKVVTETVKSYEEMNILNDLRTLVKDRLLLPNFEKLWWTRDKKYGYYYWKKTNEINLEERVRWLNDSNDEKCDTTCNNIYGGLLKRLITKACNQPLPKQHSTCWEILIGNICEKCQDINEKNDQLKQNIPILFRIHHSLGDGVALLRLLLEAIADNKNFNYSVPLNQNIINEKSNNYNHHQNNSSIYIDQLEIPLLRKRSSLCGKLINSPKIIYYSADLLSASMPFVNILSIIYESLIFIKKQYVDSNLLTVMNFTFKKIKIVINNYYKWMLMYILQVVQKLNRITEKFIKIIIALILLPSFLVRQALRSMDNSAIHGPLLTGDKIISCWMEDNKNVHENDNSSLLEKIRDIKNITGVRFGDVILAALSTNLHKYFHQIGEVAPKTITVILPMRMVAPSQKLILKNGFSVGLLPLCVSEINGKMYDYPSGEDDNDPWGLFDRLYDISQSSEKLRNDSDYLINYWVMNWLSAALPEVFLRPLLHSRSTMVFSNLPGPQAVEISGNTLKKVVFWIPNRGTTGIGCAFLSYNGNVHLSILADTSVIYNEMCLDEILKGTVNDIKKMHENIKLSYSLKNFK